MAKRTRLILAEDVLDERDLEDEDDDFDEPMMPRSNDEFSDCDLEEGSVNVSDDDDEQIRPPSPNQQASSTPPH